MLDSFHLQNMSIDWFVKGMHVSNILTKYAFMSHYFGNILSIFTRANSSNFTPIMPSITPSHLLHVRALPSFQRSTYITQIY